MEGRLRVAVVVAVDPRRAVVVALQGVVAALRAVVAVTRSEAAAEDTGEDPLVVVEVPLVEEAEAHPVVVAGGEDHPTVVAAGPQGFPWEAEAVAVVAHRDLRDLRGEGRAPLLATQGVGIRSLPSSKTL